jgi:IclR family acetate operon transcriptional repressor
MKVTVGVNEVRSVMTALRVLDEVAAREPIGVGELARLLELPKSSVQRTLRTLPTAGWIHPAGAESTRWGLTTHILRTGQRATGGLGLRDVAVPVMEELRSATQETVHLVVPSRIGRSSSNGWTARSRCGRSSRWAWALPIAGSANRKAILATRSRGSGGLCWIVACLHTRPQP